MLCQCLEGYLKLSKQKFIFYMKTENMSGW